METARHELQPPRLSSGSEQGATAVDPLGSQYVSQTIRYIVKITPGSGVIAGGPCDALLFSADTTATIVAAEGLTSEPAALPLVGKVWHWQSATKVTAASGGVDVFAGWTRRPPEAP